MATTEVPDTEEEPVQKFYDPKRETRIPADASQLGLGAVLLELHEETWQPVAYASRALTGAEVNYAQTEKELLGTTYACEGFIGMYMDRLLR